MPLTSTREIVEAGRAAGRGIAAFNVITLEHAEAIVAGAEEAGTSVILQISENAVAYHDGNVFPIAAASAAVAEGAGVDVSLHLDHVEDQQLLHRAAEAGFSSVMYDASKLDFADNVAATREMARWGRAHGLYIEAELGAVGGKGGAHTPGVRTDPDEAARFVADTGVDALAVAVGSSHAMTERTASLDFELIARLREAVAVPLVLHGSSGVADPDLQRAVRSGIVKVNIGTILNVAFTEAVRQSLNDPSVVDPRKYFAPARARVAAIVARLAATVSGPG
jgi:fructose-bisphosphate aldolase class II